MKKYFLLLVFINVTTCLIMQGMEPDSLPAQETHTWTQREIDGMVDCGIQTNVYIATHIIDSASPEKRQEALQHNMRLRKEPYKMSLHR